MWRDPAGNTDDIVEVYRRGRNDERRSETEQQVMEVGRLQAKLDATEQELLEERRLCRRLQDAYLRLQESRERQSQRRNPPKVRSTGCQTSPPASTIDLQTGNIHERNEPSRRNLWQEEVQQVVSYVVTPASDEPDTSAPVERVELFAARNKSSWWAPCPVLPEQPAPWTPDKYREHSSPTFLESPEKMEDGQAGLAAAQPGTSSASASFLEEDDSYSSENEFEVIDGKVQLGFDVAIDLADYKIMMESCGDQKFWTRALTSLWPLNELLGRSVTGKAARKWRHKRRRPAAKPRLDPLKMQAASRAFRRYIRLCPTECDPMERRKRVRQLASTSLGSINNRCA